MSATDQATLPDNLVSATVIARSGDTPSRDTAIAKVTGAIGGEVQDHPGPEAGVIFLQGTQNDLGDFRTRAIEAIGDTPADVIVEMAATRKKALFLADMDSTMIGQECIDELAAELGLKDRIAAITERAMRGEIDFEPALRERVALLKGLPGDIASKVIAERITLSPGAVTLVKTMRQSGTYTALVSGGFTLFTGPVSEMIGFHEHRSNELIIEGGKLAGSVSEPILGREAKRERLESLRAEKSLDSEAIMAIGDGANDLAMLQAAGLGVAYRAKPAVAAAAHARLEHADLTALLYAQGYRREDFVEP